MTQARCPVWRCFAADKPLTDDPPQRPRAGHYTGSPAGTCYSGAASFFAPRRLGFAQLNDPTTTLFLASVNNREASPVSLLVGQRRQEKEHEQASR
jgi:hypothetical protein